MEFFKKLLLQFLIYSSPDRFMAFFFFFNTFFWFSSIRRAHTLHVAAEFCACSTHYNGKSKWNHSSKCNIFDLLFGFTHTSQNYCSNEENAKSCFWTALVTVLAVRGLFGFIHFLCSVNYFALRYVYWSVYLTVNLCFVGLGLRRLLELSCGIRPECWALHR